MLAQFMGETGSALPALETCPPTESIVLLCLDSECWAARPASQGSRDKGSRAPARHTP